MINEKRTKIHDILTKDYVGKEVDVWGWVRTARSSKDIMFVHLNDGSCFPTLQLVVDSAKVEVDKTALLTGATVHAVGEVVESPGKEQNSEIQVKSIEVVGKTDEEYPMQKKRHSLEFLRTMPHLRNRTNTFLAVQRVRNALGRAMHDFFQENGFTYVHTPILTLNDCEGAGETFKVTTLDIEGDPKRLDPKKDFFGRSSFLTVSGQLEGEAYAMSHGEIYTFGPTFRADPSDTPRHAAEFWMIEPEMAFYDFDDLKMFIERFVKDITRRIKDDCKDEYNFFKRWVEKDLEKRYEAILDNEFPTISYTEAIEILVKNKKRFENEPKWGLDLFQEHEKFLAQEVFKKPLFVTDYPECFKSFYMRMNDDKKTVACLDLLLPDIGEILTGSQREERYDLLKERLEIKGMEVELYDWYLQLRKWGTAPHSGFGIGFERILMYLTGMKNIRDVLPFPRAGRKLY